MEFSVFVPTQDGARLNLQVYPPEGTSGHGLPVLCLHGLGANRNNFDLFGDPSALPRLLARRGHTAYVVELRSVGHSALKGAPRGDVDAYLDQDLPAVVDYILAQQPGAAEVHWVGHSLGAMLGWIYGARHPGLLASLTAIAGPLPRAVPIIGRDWVVALRHLIRGKVNHFKLPNRHGALVFKRTPRLARLAYEGLLFEGDNLDNQWLLKVAEQCLENVSFAVLRRLAEWATDKGPHAGEIERALAHLRVPSLFIAAEKDRLAPPGAVAAAAALMPAGFATVRIQGRRHGDAVDFGHGDLVVSPAAQKSVYPLVLEFIAEHDHKRSSAAA